MRRSETSALLARVRRRFRQFTWGGEWAVPLPAHYKHNLTWFWFDGLFATASDNLFLTYLVLYLLALGASREQIGLMSSFSSLAAALVLLPGALLVERFGRRKETTVVFGGLFTRTLILLMALGPILFGGNVLIWTIILLSVGRDLFGNLAFPAWMSLTGEIVPIEGRGRYFGSRNFIYGLVGMLVTFLGGELITHLGSPVGYQVAFGASFLIGSLATYSFSRLRDPRNSRPVPAPGSLSLAGLLRDLRCQPAFISLCLVSGLWNFGINLAGPFFNPRMVQDLGFTATMVGLSAIMSAVSSLLVQRWSGRLSDRIGPRQLQLLCMLFIPLLPFAWIFITQFWQVLLLNSFGGALWGAYSLVSFNLLLTLTPDAQRARYSAVFQILITISLALGAAAGSVVIGRWGYQGVFLGSALIRLLAAVLFIFFVPGRAVSDGFTGTASRSR